MQSPSTLKKHAALVDRMATAQGVDLEEQAMRGALSIGEIEDAVLRCTGCTDPEACQHWLSTQASAGSPPPDYCRNTEMFDALKGPDNG